MNNLLRAEAREYFSSEMLRWNLDQSWHSDGGPRFRFDKQLTKLADAMPDANAYKLKAMQYGFLAENCVIHIFDNAPFWCEAGLTPPIADGQPAWSEGGWLFRRNSHLCRDVDPEGYDEFSAYMRIGLHLCCGPYSDNMHMCWPVVNAVKHGFRYFYDKASALLPSLEGNERDFIECMLAGLLAVKRLGERFSDAARRRMGEVSDPKAKKYLSMVADSAASSPWEKPRHFFEGLNTLWFCRDICGALDGIGNSHLGRPDLYLIDLYNADLESGFMTRDEARELVESFVTLGDCHYDKDKTVDTYSDHELEMGFELGGCDSDGNEVYNELTVMFLDAHRDCGCVYPKVHLRYSASSSESYLRRIAEDYLSGRSVAGLSNDDAIIPALVRAGKSLEDARNFANYGCWGVASEGNESCSGGNYIHALRTLEYSVNGDPSGISGIEPLDGCESFEELYTRFLGNYIRPMRRRCEIIGKNGPVAERVNPLPLLSSCMNGCLDKLRDFTAGGSKYNPSELDISEFANAIDALCAIKSIVFDQKAVPLSEYLDAVRSGWRGNEPLRRRALLCPHFGDGGKESTAIARRFFSDFYNASRDLINEHGGSYDINFYVYREYVLSAAKMPATADGRLDGEPFAMGICPARSHRTDSLPSMIDSIAALDPLASVNSSVTIQLPSHGMTPELFTSLLRTMSEKKLKHIQINVADEATLRDAKVHPERHENLVVRVCGFSAKFAALGEIWQDEMIARCSR